MLQLFACEDCRLEVASLITKVTSLHKKLGKTQSGMFTFSTPVAGRCSHMLDASPSCRLSLSDWPVLPGDHLPGESSPASPPPFDSGVEGAQQWSMAISNGQMS